MKRKIIALCLIVAMLGVAVISGTMAYFTDTAEAVNVMTIGSVKIEQIEQEFDENNELVPFTQAKPLLPFVPADLTAQSPFSWDASSLNYGDGIPAGAYRRFAMENVVDKYVTVTNTGKSEAYVRTLIALEMGEYNADLAAFANSGIGLSINAASGTEFQFDGAWVWTDDFAAEIDGKWYNVMVAEHQAALKPGETTIPSLLQVYLSKDAKQEDAAKLDGNKNGTYDILVLSQGVQASGFGSADVALDEAFGAPTATSDDGVTMNAVAWLSKLIIPTVVETADELADAITAGGTVMLASDVDLGTAMITIPAGTTATLDLNGHDLTGTYTGADHYAMFKIPNGAALTVKGDGEVKATTKSEVDNRSLAIFQNAGELTLDGGEYTLTDSSEGKTWIIATIVDNRTSNSSCAAKLTINGGEFSVNGKAINLFRNYPQQGGTATLIINDGVFHANSGATTTYIWNQEAGSYLGELYFNGGTYDANVVYEDYNGQSDIHIADGVTINGYSGNN